MSSEADASSDDTPVAQLSKDQGSGSKNRLIRIIANTSLLTAVLVYMGWAYENALFNYFNVSPLNLNFSIVNYALYSLDVFINAQIIIFTLVLIAIIVLCSRSSHAVTWFKRMSQANHLAVLGALITAAAGSLLGFGSYSTWFFSNTYFFCLVIGLVGVGPLLLTWPSPPNAPHRPGQFLYPLAIVVAAACVLWAAETYAAGLGTQEAERMANGGSTLAAVALYSTQPLALSGGGIEVQSIHRSMYHYRYYGLRLLTDQSGTYYLVPVDYNYQPHTYIITDSDQIRVELSPGS
jgi:magnesium-transporting ATPase (P-type)